ncbi:MAG: hypothetical protein HYY18_19360 [Planctomycetes bacterium]|nr:hypothetical protein [Planctomycetota bacterium]
MKRPLILILALACACSAAAEPDIETCTCDGLAGWQSGAVDGSGAVQDSELTAADGRVVLSYERGRITPLAHYALLTELKELRIKVRSACEATFVIVFEDRDGATFNLPLKVPALEWTELKARPEAFKMNADSPTAKAAVEPARLGLGYVLIDSAAFTRGTGRNTIEIDEVEIEREPIERREGDFVVEGTVELAQSLHVAGAVRVRPGGRLRVTAPRFVAAGDLHADDGTLEFEGGVVVVAQRFIHERTWWLHGASRLSFRKALVSSGSPFGVKTRDASSLDAAETRFLGGMSCDVGPEASVTLTGAIAPGEFIIAPGGKVVVENSREVVLWLALGANHKGAFSVPAGEAVADWASPAGHAVRVKGGVKIRFCVISFPGSDGTVEPCDLSAAGLIFGGKTAVEIADLHDGQPVREWSPGSSDRKIVFRGTRVAAWNLYAADDAKVTLRRCTFGESMGFGRARIAISESTCDGKGGYIGAHERSEIRLTACRLDCPVIARDDATVVLENCTVNGDVRATGRATVRLKGTAVSGKIEADAGARVERE